MPVDFGWIVAISLILFDILLAGYLGPQVSRYYMKQIIRDIWNQKVELEDLNGEVIKVPITTLVKDKDGKEYQKTDYIVAPLWYSVMYGTSEIVGTKVIKSVASMKGKGSAMLNKMMTGELMESGVLDPADGQLIALADALGGQKWAKRAAVALGLKKKFGGPSSGTGTTQGGRGGPI